MTQQLLDPSPDFIGDSPGADRTNSLCEECAGTGIDRKLALCLMTTECPCLTIQNLMGECFLQRCCEVCRHAQVHSPQCANCSGKGPKLGRIWLLDPEGTFGLRVEKQGVWSHRDCKSMGVCQNLLADGSAPKGITDCQGRGWTPNPADWPYVRAAKTVYPDASEQGFHLREALRDTLFDWVFGREDSLDPGPICFNEVWKFLQGGSRECTPRATIMSSSYS